MRENIFFLEKMKRHFVRVGGVRFVSSLSLGKGGETPDYMYVIGQIFQQQTNNKWLIAVVALKRGSALVRAFTPWPQKKK